MGLFHFLIEQIKSDQVVFHFKKGTLLLFNHLTMENEFKCITVVQLGVITASFSRG